MRINYEACLKAVLKWEGGYVNHPLDPGGATNYGVTQARYDQYRRDNKWPLRHVKQIAGDEVRAIYRKYYWNAIKGDQLPAGIDLAVFDYAVNSGPSRAVKHLQKIIGVKVDGILGQQTLNAIFSMYPDTIVNRLCDRRQRFVRGLSIYSTFGRGWENRIRDIRKTSLLMADSVIEPVPVNNSKPSILEVIFNWLASFLKS